MSEWQPIDTAPRDGTPIQAWFGDRVGVRQVIWDEAVNGSIGWCVDDNKFGPYSLRGYNDPFPTHWQPLPEPPTSANMPE